MEMVKQLVQKRHTFEKHKYKAGKFFLKAALLTTLTVAPLTGKTDPTMSNLKNDTQENKYILCNYAQQESCIRLGQKPIEQMTEREKACELFAITQQMGLQLAISGYHHIPDWVWDRFFALIDEAASNPNIERLVIKEMRFYDLHVHKLFSKWPEYERQQSLFEKDGKKYYLIIMGKARALGQIMNKTCFVYLPSSIEREVVLPKINRFLKEELHSDVRLDESFFSNIAKHLNPRKTMEKTGLGVEDQLELLKFLMREDLGLIWRGFSIFLPMDIDEQKLKSLADRAETGRYPGIGYHEKSETEEDIEPYLIGISFLFIFWYLHNLIKKSINEKRLPPMGGGEGSISDRIDSRYGIDGPPPQTHDWY